MSVMRSPLHTYTRVQVRTRQKSVGPLLAKIGVGFLLVFFALIFMVPLLWLIVTALKSVPELNTFPIQLLPSRPLWDNFVKAVTEIDYWRYARNSLVLATIQSTLITITSAMVGFGFARLRSPGKRQLFITMLATTMLPGMIAFIPTYIIFSRLGMVDTYWPWVIWGLGSSPFFNFLFRQFFMSIPVEVEEAAIVDGCSYWRMFWQIFLPLSRPVLAIVLIFAFTGVWDDFLAPSLFLSPENTTLAVAISNNYLDAQGHAAENIIAASSLIYALPVLLVFILTQRFLKNTGSFTGLKG